MRSDGREGESQDRVHRIFKLLELTTPEQRGEFLWEAGSPIEPVDEVHYVTRISNTSRVSPPNREVNAQLERRPEGDPGRWQYP